jgi:hypothetical protein
MINYISVYRERERERERERGNEMSRRKYSDGTPEQKTYQLRKRNAMSDLQPPSIHAQAAR